MSRFASGGRPSSCVGPLFALTLALAAASACTHTTTTADTGNTDGSPTDGAATDGGGTDSGIASTTSTVTNLFDVAFDMVIDGKPYHDRCIGSFIKMSLDPTGSPAVDGVLSCDWQDELGAAFGITTMGGLIDGEASGTKVSGSWSLGPIAEPWTGSFDAQGNLSGTFTGKGKLNYGGTDVSYSYDGSLQVDAD